MPMTALVTNSADSAKPTSPAWARWSTAGRAAMESPADRPALARFSSAPAASTLVNLVLAPASSAAFLSATISSAVAPVAALTRLIALSRSAAPLTTPAKACTPK